MLCRLFFAWADILSEKNPYFGKHFFCKTKTDYEYKLRVQDFATGKNFSFNQCFKQESFAFFSRESYFIKAIENGFPVFAYPEINTREVGRILDSYANPRLRLGLAQLSRILPTRLVFISGYANTENVFYCLNDVTGYSEIIYKGIILTLSYKQPRY